MVPHARSKKWRFAFQTFTETPATTPSILGFGITHQPHEGGGWCEMWCEIRRHTLRHLYRGYWSALRVERMRSNHHCAGETSLHLVFGHAEATASVITSGVWGFGRVVSIHRSSETRLPWFGNATPLVPSCQLSCNCCKAGSLRNCINAILFYGYCNGRCVMFG